MIDLKILRENPSLIKESQIARGDDPNIVDTLIDLDKKRREFSQKLDDKRFDQKKISNLVRKSTGDEKAKNLADAKLLASEIKGLETEFNEIDIQFNKIYQSIGNLILEGVPSGGEENFKLVETVGEIPKFENPKDHLEIGESLKLIDMERGAKVSGARFYFLTGMGAMLHIALMNLAAKTAIENGFQLMIPPVLVKPEIMAGTGFLGEHSDEIYYLPEDEMYLVGTSEVALAGYHSNEIIELDNSSKRYAGWSTCFRREAGSYGKDVRGIIRVHQFDKLEMFSYTKIEDSEAEHLKLLNLEKSLLTAMELPFRVIDVAAGDLGSSAARKFDCEAWLPSQERYLELTSTSNCTTYQSRRLKIRYRDENKKTMNAATVNGTLATMRWLVAILENHQQSDGSLKIPAALVPFMGVDTIRPEK